MRLRPIDRARRGSALGRMTINVHILMNSLIVHDNFTGGSREFRFVIEFLINHKKILGYLEKFNKLPPALPLIPFARQLRLGILRQLRFAITFVLRLTARWR